MTDEPQEIESGLHDPWTLEKESFKFRVAEGGTIETKELTDPNVLILETSEMGFLHGKNQQIQHDYMDLLSYCIRLTGVTGTVSPDGFTVNADTHREVIVCMEPDMLTRMITNLVLTYFPGDITEELFRLIRAHGNKAQGDSVLNNLFSFLETQVSDQGEEK